MDQFPPEDIIGTHITPAISPHMQSRTNLSATQDVYNSTLPMRENTELSATSEGIVKNMGLSLEALWFYFAVRILWGGLAMVGNSLTILVVAKFERLQTCTNYLICNLAATDLIAVVVVPLVIVHDLVPDNIFFIPTCLFEKVLTLLTTGGSMGTILYLSIDRYVYIAHPLRYHTLVTPKRLVTILGLSWAFVFLTIPAMVLLANHLQVGMPCTYYVFLDSWVVDFFLFPLFGCFILSTVSFHLAIAKIAHHQARAIAALQQPYDTLDMTIAQSTKKISRTLGMVLGVYLMSILPQFITAWVIKGDMRFLPLKKFTNLLYSANTWVNPLIYAWRLKDFRIAFRKLLTGTGSFNEVP